MKYTGPKVRLSRRIGVPLTPKASKVMERKPHPPGQFGRRPRRRKESDYGRQLKEKQLLRYHYNVTERQMRNCYGRASRQSGNTIEDLARDLELRLDALLVRSGLARTAYAARQLINHRHIEVDGKIVDAPGYRMSTGELLAVKEKSRNLQVFREALEKRASDCPYLDVDREGFSARLTREPHLEEIPVPCDFTQVIAYYSR